MTLSYSDLWIISFIAKKLKIFSLNLFNKTNSDNVFGKCNWFPYNLMILYCIDLFAKIVTYYSYFENI